MQRTHYEILGLAKDASPQDVKAAYRRIVRTSHPDVGGSAALFGLVQEAYDTLQDPTLRRDYDASLLASPSEMPEPAPHPTPEPPPPPPPPPTPAPAFAAAAAPTYADAPLGDTQTSPSHKEPSSVTVDWGGLGFFARIFLGVSAVMWVVLSDCVRYLYRAAGWLWVDAPSWEGSSGPLFFYSGGFAGNWQWVTTWFLIGFLLIPFFYAARRLWRPFPWWDQAFVFIFTATATPLGLWWFSSWSLLGLGVLVGVYFALNQWILWSGKPVLKVAKSVTKGELSTF